MASSTSLSVSCARSEGARRNEAMSRETKARNLEFMANKLATRLPCRNLAVHEGQSSCEPRALSWRRGSSALHNRPSNRRILDSIYDLPSRIVRIKDPILFVNWKFVTISSRRDRNLDRPHPVRLFSHGQTLPLIKLVRASGFLTRNSRSFASNKQPTPGREGR